MSAQLPTKAKANLKDADYIFYELTRSLCPVCRRLLDEPGGDP